MSQVYVYVVGVKWEESRTLFRTARAAIAYAESQGVGVDYVMKVPLTDDDPELRPPDEQIWQWHGSGLGEEDL